MLTMQVFLDSNKTGHLRLNTRPLGVAGRTGARVIDISPCFAPERERVEAFIKDIYKEKYDADITVDYPILMSVRTADGEILSAVGFRYAAENDLFLERYVGAPIEQSISQTYKSDIERGHVAEIGNLASKGGGASIYLFAALSSYLQARGIAYATITGTNFIRKRLRKLGLKPRILCAADPALLHDEERNRWGTYYDQEPHVLVGSVEEGVHHLQRALGVVYEEYPDLSMISRLHYKGAK